MLVCMRPHCFVRRMDRSSFRHSCTCIYMSPVSPVYTCHLYIHASISCISLDALHFVCRTFAGRLLKECACFVQWLNTCGQNTCSVDDSVAFFSSHFFVQKPQAEWWPSRGTVRMANKKKKQESMKIQPAHMYKRREYFLCAGKTSAKGKLCRPTYVTDISHRLQQCTACMCSVARTTQ